MKNLVFSILVIFLCSCNENKPIDFAILSGSISNPISNEITLYGKSDASLKFKMTIDEVGHFIDTINLDKGEFLLYDGENRIPVYLTAGNDIKINYDAKDFKSSLLIAGIGMEATNYLKEKADHKKEFVGERGVLYKKDEIEYSTAITKLKNQQEAKLSETNSLSSSFVEAEKLNIQYAYYNYVSIYKDYHAHYADDSAFEVSDSFNLELNDLNYDDIALFNQSYEYKKLITTHYQNKVAELTKKDSLLDPDITLLNSIKIIKNKPIQNYLAYNSAKYGITYTKDLEAFYAAYKAVSSDEENNKKIEESYEALKVLEKGMPSPIFVGYENNSGGTSSLADFKGKYVYMDVWATWCGPCIREIPSLIDVEKKYHDKNIEFVSISIDKQKDHDKWKKMIVDKGLGGVQLMADNDWSSDFVEAYMIKGIPKFILVGPDGTIIESNAPRPSSDDLITLLEGLDLNKG